MLLLCEKDDYWRGRRDCDAVTTADGMIYSRWRPWRDVVIATWLIAMGDWQLRVHRIHTARALDTAEGGFSVPNRPLPQVLDGEGGCRIITPADTSAILCLSPQRRCGGRY